MGQKADHRGGGKGRRQRGAAEEEQIESKSSANKNYHASKNPNLRKYRRMETCTKNFGQKADHRDQIYRHTEGDTLARRLTTGTKSIGILKATLWPEG